MIIRSIFAFLPAAFIAFLCLACSSHKSDSTAEELFVCENRRSFKVRYSEFGEEALVAMEKCTIRLPRVPSASGTRFSNGQVTLQTKGGSANLQLPKGGELRNCHSGKFKNWPAEYQRFEG